MEPLIRARKKYGVLLHSVSTLPSPILVVSAGWIEKPISPSKLERFLAEYREKINGLKSHLPAELA